MTLQTTQQGHVYYHQGRRVLIIEPGRIAQALVLDGIGPWPAQRCWVHANDLTPAPMRYFHGQTPGGQTQ